MLKLDNNLLDELGLRGLPEEQKKAMLQHIYETLELRVGTDLANQMTDQQLEEFEKFIDDGGDANQAQALQWLERNLPHYKDVVNRVFEELKTEIKNMAPQIMASSTSQYSVPQPVVDPGMYSQPQQPAAQAPGQAPVTYLRPEYAPQPVPNNSQQQPNYGAQPQIPPQPYPQQQPPAGPGSYPPYTDTGQAA